jgi:hypothetical protein
MMSSDYDARTAGPPSHHEVLASDLLPENDQLQEELRRLSAANQELLSEMGREPSSPAYAGEIERLRNENAELRDCISEMERAWLEREQEYEALLEEKSEIIRGLHLKLQEESTSSPSALADPGSVAEVARLRKEMEEQRRQLEEDEAALMEQMREMEMAMSRERAEMARQRNELQRLHADLTHEAEQSARDAGLRDRLQSLRRKYEPAPTQTRRTPDKTPTISEPTPRPRGGSGLIRRIFGGADTSTDKS